MNIELRCEFGTSKLKEGEAVPEPGDVRVIIKGEKFPYFSHNSDHSRG